MDSLRNLLDPPCHGEAVVNYLAFLRTPISLYTQDKVFRDEREVFVRDVRQELRRFTIETEGFEYMHDKVDAIKNWEDEEHVRDVLLKQTPELIKKRLGATRVYITAQRIRHSDSSGIKSDTTPVYAIHGDATRQSGMELLQNSIAKMDPAPKPESLPPHSHVMLVNVWRPLKTITRDPLGFLVPSTIQPSERHEQIFSRPADTFKVFGRPIGDYWLDTASYGERQEWVFLKHQTPEEPVMFVQWDSRGVEEGKFENKINLVHSCFVDEEYANDPERASMKLKCLVFFGE